jgi:hypothetical protein
MNLRGSPDYEDKAAAVREWGIATVGMVNFCWSSPEQSILNIVLSETSTCFEIGTPLNTLLSMKHRKL